MKRIYADLFDNITTLCVLGLIFVGYGTNNSQAIVMYKPYLVTLSVLSYLYWYYVATPLKSANKTWGKKIFKVDINYTTGSKVINIIGREFFMNYLLTVLSFGLMYVINIYNFKIRNKGMFGDNLYKCNYEPIKAKTKRRRGRK